MKILFLEKFQPIVILLISIASMSLVSACYDQPPSVIPSAVMQKNDTTTKKFTAAMVDNKSDPNCGMPVTAGIADTVHYHGKIYGFCSNECKQAFLKNPEVLAKNTTLK